MTDATTIRQEGFKMLRVSEAAKLLHIHPNTLRKWNSLGLIPSYRIGRRRDRRFLLEDVLNYLKSSATA